MNRYYDVENKQEWVPPQGATSIPPGIVSLAESNPFWQPLPPGHELIFNVNGIPSGTQEIPVTPEQLLRDDMHEAEISMKRIVAALYLAERGFGTPLMELSEAVDAIAVEHDVGVVEAINEWLGV